LLLARLCLVGKLQSAQLLMAQSHTACRCTHPALATAPACRGSGLVYVAYLDPSLRIFKASNGSLSLQVRQKELARLLGRPAAAP
jgi:hypothetical protein